MSKDPEHMSREELLELVSRQEDIITDLRTDLESLQAVAKGGMGELQELRRRDQRLIKKLDAANAELSTPIMDNLHWIKDEDEHKLLESGLPLLKWDETCAVAARVWLLYGPDPLTQMREMPFKFRTFPASQAIAEIVLPLHINAVLNHAIIPDDVKSSGLIGVSIDELYTYAHELQPYPNGSNLYLKERRNLFNGVVWPKMKAAGCDDREASRREFNRKLNSIRKNAAARWENTKEHTEK